MDTIAKTVVSNKLSSLGRNIGFDDEDSKEEQGTISAKEKRKIQEKEAVEKAKREEKYAKRNAERQKKRDDIRAKYGIQKDQKGQPLGKTAPKEVEKNEDDKQCVVM